MGIFPQSVIVHDHAKKDVADIAKANIDVAATVLVFLEQLKVDPKTTIDVLTTRGENELFENRINVKEWQKVKRFANLWRLRVLDTPATMHRIFYGYHYQTQQLCVLAVVDKENYDYDDLTTEINKRIIADWQSIANS